MAEAGKRVLFIDHSASMSGAELAMVVLAEGAESFEPVVLLGEAGPLESRLSTAEVKFHVADVGPGLRAMKAKQGPTIGVVRAGFGALRFASAIRRVLRAERPDFVIANTAKSQLIVGLMAPLVRRRAKLIFYMRDQLTRAFFSWGPFFSLQLLHAISPDGIIANSRSTLATANRFARRKPSIVLPSPILLPSESRRPGRGDGFHFGMVARLSPWKGQLETIRAFGAAQLGDDTHLWIVGGALFGETDYEQRLRSLVEEMQLKDRVHFTGHLSDVYQSMSDWDVLIHFSTKPEPFGQVILQGMACGLPIIASDAGGPAELLTDKRNGLLVPLGDLDALRATMQRLRVDPELRWRLGRAALLESELYHPAEIRSRFAEFCGSLTLEEG